MEVTGRRSDNNKDVSTIKKGELCQPCNDEHTTTSADGICRECKEYMCNTCFRHHLKARNCRNHVLIDASRSSMLLNVGNEDIERCRHHENEKIKYYCRIHDIVGCGDCMLAEHTACKPEFIKNLSSNFQKDDNFKQLVRKIEKLVSTIKDSENAIQDEKREIKTMHEVALKEIRKFRADIDEYLDKAEADVSAELNRFKSGNEDLLAKLEKNCKLHASKTEEVQKSISTKICREETLFINYVRCKSDVLDIERAVAELQSENNIKKIAFIADKHLHDIVTSGIKLGSIEDQNIQPISLEKGKDAAGMIVSSKKVVTEKRKDIRSKSEDTGARGRPLQDKNKNDDIVFETFKHSSGKEFQCVYQNGVRFYLDDWGSKEWHPFPKRWYHEGLLVTNSLLKDENTMTESNQGQSFSRKCSGHGQGQGSGHRDDDRDGVLMHPTKGRIRTYIFYKKHNVHMYFDRDTGSWTLMPIAWELHHEMINSLVDQIDEAVPTWGDRHDILALLRACQYDPDECISTYKHLEGDEWMQRPKATK